MDNWRWVLRGYDEVMTDCQIGFAGRGPVPYSSILAYCREEDLTVFERRYFKRLVRELDEERFEHEATHRSGR